MLNTKANTTWCARILLVLMSLGFATSANAATIYTFTCIDRSGIDVAARSRHPTE
jgi:hypothetical protein